LTLASNFSDPAVMTDRPPGFAVERAPLSGAPGVLVRGEVDVGTAPKLTAALGAAIRESRGAFVIDLCDVAFLDSCGVSVLVRARAVLGREERALVTVCPPGPARRIFEFARNDDLLTLFDSRDQAAASLQPAM
jgi:anti-sigma B factor antagonist